LKLKVEKAGKMTEKPFRNKVVVVTGGASGIGLALCQRFAVDGAKIGMLDMDGEALKAARESLSNFGVDNMGIVCDVSSRQQCEDAIASILKQYGGIDVLVNNAGITQRGAFRATRISVFEKVMAVNFFGSLYCTKAAIESIVKRKGLIIVNESVAGLAPLLGRTGYSASKHALNGLFTSLRTELFGTGAHVMIVCPGFVKTNLQTRALGGDGQVTDHPQSTVGSQDTPEAAAEDIYKAAVKRKNLLVLTPIGKISYWISRLAPVVYERMMAKKLRAELE
jgi:NAD(P)-dependent dehydrogenase (short-subunit alcohol dehydrogenase family)